MKNKILILDIETTGFLNTGGKIVEVGIVELDTQTGASKILYDKVTHETPITREEVENSWIVKNGYMKTEEIRTSPNFQKIKHEIQEILDQYPEGATAYNNAFDFGFLEDRGLRFPHKLPCPMKIATNICKIKGPRGYKWPKVEEAYAFFFPDSDYEEKHRGADDAYHEAAIVYELIIRGKFQLKAQAA